MKNTKWSDADRKIARRAFDAALQRECAALVEQFRTSAAQVKNLDDIWVINDYLTEQRKLIGRKYDYRYSQLIFLFGQLLREKFIEAQDIEGLSEEKLQYIHHLAAL
ncbi:MAG: hypothetical protein WAO71_14445 [Gallionella sp.]